MGAQLSLPFKTHADFVAVWVPPGAIRGDCIVRAQGISYQAASPGQLLDISVRLVSSPRPSPPHLVPVGPAWSAPRHLGAAR